MPDPDVLRPVAPVGRIDSIQLLRGIAASLVAIFHLWAAAAVVGYQSAFLDLFRHGEAGVDIFFVISGFIIVYSVEARGGMTPVAFAKARFWRILPPYWAILTLYLGLAAGLSVIRPETAEFPSAFTLVVSYLLLPYPEQVITIAWTLSVELLFYIVFGLTYLKFGRPAFLVAMVLWVLATQVFAYAVPVKSDWLLIALHTAVLEFLFGALIAFAYLSRNTPFQIPVLIGGIVLMALHLGNILVLPVAREFMPGIPAAMIVYGALGIQKRLPELAILWGESSYILYLAHLLIFAVLGNLIKIGFGFDVYLSGWAMAGLFGVVVVLSALATKYAEQPYQRWYKRKFMKR